MIRNIFTLSLSLFIAGIGIVSALNFPAKVQKGEMLTSQNWNTMIDALSQMQQTINTLQNQLNNKANLNQIPNLSEYATLSEVDRKIQNTPQASSVCPAGKTLHLCVVYVAYGESDSPSKSCAAIGIHPLPFNYHSSSMIHSEYSLHCQ